MTEKLIDVGVARLSQEGAMFFLFVFVLGVLLAGIAVIAKWSAGLFEKVFDKVTSTLAEIRDSINRRDDRLDETVRGVLRIEDQQKKMEENQRKLDEKVDVVSRYMQALISRA